MTTRGKPLSQASADDAWRGLFDVNYLDHVCERLSQHIDGGSPAERLALASTIRNRLLDPLSTYMRLEWDRVGRATTSVEAAQQLFAALEKLAEQFRDRWPFDAGDSGTYVPSIRDAWTRLIAVGAGGEVWHAQPRRIQRARKAASMPRPRDKTVPKLTDEAVKQALLEHGKDKRTALVDQLAGKFSVSRRTAERRISAVVKKQPT